MHEQGKRKDNFMSDNKNTNTNAPIGEFSQKTITNVRIPSPPKPSTKTSDDK